MMQINRSVVPIRAVVFDMGGVLTVDPFEAARGYAEELGIPGETFVDQMRGPMFAAVERGESTIRDYLKFACGDVQQRFTVAVDIRRLADCLAAGQQVRPEMVALVGELADRDVKLGILTNNAKEARSWWSSGVLPLEHFAAVVDSSEIGVRKPDPLIFAVTAQRLQLEPGEVLYFDDTAENVVGAASAGLVAEAFTDPAECRMVCARHGLV